MLELNKEATIHAARPGREDLKMKILTELEKLEGEILKIKGKKP